MKTPIAGRGTWLRCPALLRRAALSFLTLAMIPAFSIGFVSVVRGAAIQGVTTNAVSSEFVSLPDIRRAESLINNDGIYGDYFTTSPRRTMWLTSPTTAGAYSNAFVILDLGTNQFINQMRVWNYNESTTNTQRGVQNADIAVAGDDMVFTTILPNQTFTRAPGVFTNNFDQTFILGVQARYVRINVITNFGGGIENRVGLSKIRFYNTNTPPFIKLATRSISGNRVTVRFSESVVASTATNAANYSILNGTNPVTINSVAMDSFNDRVVINTSLINSNLACTLNAQNVMAVYDSTTITNTTISIDPEFVLWLAADSGVTADGSGFVSQWADQSGATNNAAEPNSSFEPTLVTNVINGMPVLRFDGVNDGLACSNVPTLVAEGDISFYAVVTARVIPSGGVGIISKAGIPSSNTNFPATFDYELAAAGKPRLLRGNGSVATTLNGTSNAVLNVPTIMSLVVQGTNAQSYLNGFFNGRAVFADGIEDQGNPVRIGRREDNNLYLNGDIAEVMLVRGALTDSERLAIDSYLARKYRIVTPVSGPPVINTQPTNVLSYVGDSATFNAVMSTNGASPKSFQWFQTPSSSLSGQTNSALVLSGLTLGQDNTSYYLNVTNSDGTTNSASATLNVLPVTAPYFVLQPQSQTVYVHQPVTFTAVARGSSQMNYQWYFNNSPIEGATNTTLVVANTSSNYNGNFTLSVSNALGSTNSNPAALTVVTPDAGSYPAAVLSANPLLYYRFSDLNNTNITMNYGSLGSAWNGSAQGTYTADNGPLPPTFPFESTNLSFGNSTLSSGGVQFPNITFNNTNGGPHCTMAAWVYKDFGQVSFCGIIFGRTAGVCGFGVNLASSSDQFDYTWNNGQFGYNSGLIVPNSQWCFMAVVVEPTKATLYLQDGTGMKTATNTATHAIVPVLGGYIGWDTFSATRRWYGDIDEPMIFDRALSATEINALYAGTPTTPSSTATLSAKSSGGNVSITWNGNATLQRATSPTGPYSDMIGITSPYVFAPGNAGYFYRLRVQ